MGEVGSTRKKLGQKKKPQSLSNGSIQQPTTNINDLDHLISMRVVVVAGVGPIETNEKKGQVEQEILTVERGMEGAGWSWKQDKTREGQEKVSGGEM